MKMPAIRLAIHGDVIAIPKWYGLAYYEPHLNEGIFYPIPINIFIKWIHILRIWLKQGGWDFTKKQSLVIELELLRACKEKQLRTIMALRRSLGNFIEDALIDAIVSSQDGENS